MPNDSEKEQLWKIYELLPEELQKAIFSAETADAIWNVCVKYEINEVHELAKYVGDSLIGLLPPEKFQATIENGLKLDPKIAEKVASEIDRFVFYPVGPLLDKLYHREAKGTGENNNIKPEIKTDSETKEPIGKDNYREDVE